MTAKITSRSEEGLWRFMNPVAFWIACLVFVGALRDIYSLVDAFDTGLYLQWLTGYAQSRSLASSITGEANFLAHHFQPVALLFSPVIDLFGRPVALYLLSAAAVGLSWWVGRSYFLKHLRWYNGIFLLLLAQPAISGRLWFSFVPDILAFPAFFWMALQVSNVEKLRLQSKTFVFWTFAFLWAGLSKETFWLTNAAVAAVAFIHFRHQASAKWFFSVAAIVHLAVFLALFLWWMPAHTNMPSYYGLKFYFGQDVDMSSSPLTLLGLLLGNFFSFKSLYTLFLLVLLTCAVPLLRVSLVWIAAIPGLALVLLAASSQLHHPANHYLIPVLPFLLVPAFYAQERYGKIMARLRRGFGPAYLALIPIGYAVFMSFGLTDQLINVATNEKFEYLRDNVQIAKIDHLKLEDNIIVDGLLQPHFAEYPNVTVLIGHVGNPKKLDLHNLTRPLKVVTTADFKEISDCNGLRVGADQLVVDYVYFQELCVLLKEKAEVLATYKESGLNLYLLPAKPLEKPSGVNLEKLHLGK